MRGLKGQTFGSKGLGPAKSPQSALSHPPYFADIFKGTPRIGLDWVGV